jgi:hypothetical protein
MTEAMLKPQWQTKTPTRISSGFSAEVMYDVLGLTPFTHARFSTTFKIFILLLDLISLMYSFVEVSFSRALFHAPLLTGV